MGVSTAAPGALPCSPSSAPAFRGNYECWTNDVSQACDESVYRENKLKYKNVQLGPVMSDADVDALLRRKPNAVKNIINSLNEQMRHKGTGKVDVELLGHSQSRTGVYEPEFGRELQECNISVKHRINIFDKKTTKPDQRARLIPVVQSADYKYDCAGYPDSPPMRRNTASAIDGYGTRLLGCTNTDRVLNSVTSYDRFMGAASHQDDHDERLNSTIGMGHRFEQDTGNARFLGLPQLSSHIYITGERNYTDVVQTSGPGLLSYEYSLPRNNSDIVHNSARDSFGPIHKEWSRSINSHGSPRKGENALKSNSRSPRFGCLMTGDSHGSQDTTNVWTPSVISSRSYENNSVQKIELPLDAVCRQLKVHPECSEGDSCRQAETPEPQVFTVKTGSKEVILKSVNIVKAGWTWMHSLRARRWFPKYLVLFYDDTKGFSPYQYHAALRRHQSYNVDEEKTPPSFWDIYKIYSHLGRTGHSGHESVVSDSVPTSDSKSSFRFDVKHLFAHSKLTRVPTSNTLNSADHGGSPSIHQFYNYSDNGVANSLVGAPADAVVIIPDGASVYLTILRCETQDLVGALKCGDFQELMEVDLRLAPYTKQHAPNNWLAGLISRSMGRDPLNLIHIPLVNGYECSFMPLCAVHFAGISLSYQMECARLKRVGREYEQWIFALWEYVLRRGEQPLPAAEVTSAVLRGEGNSRSFVRRLHGFVTSLLSFWNAKKDGNINTPIVQNEHTSNEVTTMPSECVEESEEHTSLRRVLMGGQSMDGDIGSPEHQQALTRGFADWIQYHGFDDLSVSMNIYTLTNRFGDC